MTVDAIIISEKTIGMWRAELPGGNWLAHLFHGGGTTLRYDDGRAERHWAIRAMRPGTSDAEAVEAAREAQDRLMSYGLGGWEMLREGRSPAEFFSAVREMPGMSTPTTEPEVIHAE
jgi:hypothetical protein